MAIAFVQSYSTAALTNSSAVTNFQYTPSATIPVGTRLILFIGVSGAAPTTFSVADNSTQAGTANTWVSDITPLTGTTQGNHYIYSADITRSILTTDRITVTTDAATGTSRTRGGVALGFTGVTTGASGYLDQVKSNNPTTSPTAHTTGSAPTSTSADLLLVGSDWYNSATTTVTPGADNQADTFIEPVADLQGGSRTLQAQYVIVNHGLAIYQSNWTATVGIAHSALLVEYKAAAAATTTPLPVSRRIMPVVRAAVR